MANNLNAKEITGNTAGNYVQANTGLAQAIAAITEQRAITLTTSDLDYTAGSNQDPTSNVYKALRSLYFKFTGTMDASHSVTLPTNKKLYIVEHACTGGFTIQFKCTGGTGVTISNGQVAVLLCNGTDMFQVNVGTGTVTSVGLAAPSQEFSVSGSPVTGSGTLTIAKRAAAMSSISGSATIDWNNGDAQVVTLTGNVTSLTLSNPVNGMVYKLVIKQDGTGGRTIAWPAAVKFAGGGLGLTVPANAVDSIMLLYDGTNYFELSRALNIS